MDQLLWRRHRRHRRRMAAVAVAVGWWGVGVAQSTTLCNALLLVRRVISWEVGV